MLLAMDVTTNDGLEEEFDLFRTATKEANTIFNYEEFGITTLFSTCAFPSSGSSRGSTLTPPTSRRTSRACCISSSPCWSS